MNRRHVDLGGSLSSGVVAYGHWGRPVLVFPSSRGRSHDFEDRGMIAAIAPLIEAGRAKLYAVDSYDGVSWFDRDVPLEERARRHEAYESWVLDVVVPWILADCGGWDGGIVTTGCSFGAYHAANFALKRADLFPAAVCLSGVYDLVGLGWGERGESFYFNNPADYVAGAEGEHLDWLRRGVQLSLVCGQGPHEDTTGVLDSTRAFSSVLAGKGIPHVLDVWGRDTPHDWTSWRRQLALHLPRFC